MTNKANFIQPDVLGYSIDGSARATGLGRSTIKALIAARRLRAVKIGRRVVIPREALEQLLREGAA